MAEEFFKGLGRYIPPEIRRFAPAVKTVAELLKPNPVVNNPNTANLLRSPTIANIGKVLSDAAITTTEILPGGKVITAPVKKVSKLASDLIEQSTTKGKLADVIKNPTTSINKALLEMGDEKIESMTIKEAAEYIKKNYKINVSESGLANKKLNFKSGRGSGSATEKLKEVFSSIENPSQYTIDQLLNFPQIKKVMNENKISKDVFIQTKARLGIKSKSATFIEKLGVNEKEMIDFLKENPSTTSTQLRVQFPKIKDVQINSIDKWRKSNEVIRVPVKEKSILKKNNPILQSQLDFVSQSGDKVLPSNIPIKHNNAFSEVVTINKKTGPLDATRTKIVQAHGIGEGGISNASKEIIKSKVAMIPEKFLKEEEIPKFFLTRSGNTAHRDIENNLILALVNKYDKLGYNFVEGAWKQTKKVNPKSITKELKDLENEILGYQDELNKLDAYTLFYNPVKDKMVTHGKPLSEIPGLSNLLNQVKKGTKKLKGGGLVGINHLTRPLGNF